jgi:predicted nucleotidyltransferase
MEVQKVVSNLRDFLLSSDTKQNIVKMILFGSYAKKTASAHSDIDILIITADGRTEEQALMDHVYD